MAGETTALAAEFEGDAGATARSAPQAVVAEMIAIAVVR